jgi:hypothetical protein
MLSGITNWSTVGVIVSILIGLGWGGMSMSPPTLNLARVCFSSVAVILLARGGWWLAFELSANKIYLIISIFLIFGIISALWLFSMKWVSERERILTNTPTSKEKQAIKPSKQPLKNKTEAGVLNRHSEQLAKPDLEENRFPLVDIKFVLVKSEPPFEHLEVQFAYDIFLYNKSSVTLSKIIISRKIDPEKNKQKIAVRQRSQTKLTFFDKQINVLSPGEGVKIYREHSASDEYMIITIVYQDEYERHFRCVFEGDRDSLLLKDKSKISTARK